MRSVDRSDDSEADFARAVAEASKMWAVVTLLLGTLALIAAVVITMVLSS